MQRNRNHPHPNPSPVKGEGLKRDSAGDENPYRNFSPERTKRQRTGVESGASRESPAAPERSPAATQQVSNRNAELRLFGVNACHAAFARRPGDLRKVYLLEERIVAFKQALAWCVKHRLGYRVVADEDLVKLTHTTHHEGICFEMVKPREIGVAELLRGLPPVPAPAVLLFLDGVGNPHNFGAVLRSAAHFAVAGVILPATTGLTLSGAACRIAEGGAESVPVARLQPAEDLPALLRSHGFSMAATTPHAGASLYAVELPPRLLLVFGAEGEGASRKWLGAAELKLSIPGSGAVESLNIAASVAVALGEWWRRHGVKKVKMGPE